MDRKQLLQNLRPCRAGADAAPPDLLTEFFVFDQLTGIFHREDHGSACIPFRRGCFSLFYCISADFQRRAFSNAFHECRGDGWITGSAVSCRPFRIPGKRGRLSCFPLSKTCHGLRNAKISFFFQDSYGCGKCFLSDHDLKGCFAVNRRRIENGKKSCGNEIINPFGGRIQRADGTKTLSGRNDGIMICDQLIVGIMGLFDFFPASVSQDLFRERRTVFIVGESGQILVDLFGDCRGKHPGIRSRIGHQFLFI